MAIPSVGGAVDRTHIKMIAPSIDKDVFVNRKKVHSINTQVVFWGAFHDFIDRLVERDGAETRETTRSRVRLVRDLNRGRLQ